MDPLTAGEYSAVLEILKAASVVGAASLYALVTLQEPAKSQVLTWKVGEKVNRAAFVIVKRGSETFESIVDLTNRRVVDWKQIPDVQPGMLLSQEYNFIQMLVLGHPEWRSAIRERGIENLRDVVCQPFTVGYFGLAEEEGRRLFKVVCYDSSGISNFWGRPLEGLTAVVDPDRREVVRIIDTGRVPIPKAPVDFDQESVGRLRKAPHPIVYQQAGGPGFRLDGRTVSWQNWSFHFRVDPRLGLVISLVRYQDQGKVRSILYQGSLSELFLSYMDPDVGWYFRAFMDAGEYGVGKLAVPLQQGIDCPETAVFFDSIFVHDWGESYRQERTACLFERYSDDLAWRHYEVLTGETETRKRTDLVLRSISAIGNYDYVFDWVFRQDGSIQVAVGSSGVEQVKAVKSRTIADDQDGRDTAYGRMVADHTVAVNHDHFFSFRLDLDVDGPENSFLYEHLKPKSTEGESPRPSVWFVDSRIAETEREARLRINLERPALWRVINPHVKGPVGYPVSYQLKPGRNAVFLLSPEEMPQKRAGFTQFHLWATHYNPGERYAAGTYPNQSKGGDGLPSWAGSSSSIRKTDLVLWYTLGFHHVVRAEDWPVLPTSWTSFELRPFDFFARNPALDLPQ